VSLKDWLTKNIYVTSPENSDVFFRPRRFNKPKGQVVEAARAVIASLKGWRVEEYRENQGLLRVSRSVLFPPSAQDIHIYVVQGLDGVTSLEMTSQSKGAKGDWGRNKRNLRDFLTLLDSSMGSG
jgi:hypothetical protein